MGRKNSKKDNSNKTNLKEAKRLKQEAKSNRKSDKKESKLDHKEEDIDSILAKHKIEIESQKVDFNGFLTLLDEPPYPRLHSTWTTINSCEVILFGGESVVNQRPKSYNETYLWNMEKNEWKKVHTSIKPKPRCSHQAVVYKDDLYVFGGDLSTTNQFYQFNDLWKLDLKNYKWIEIKTSGNIPTPRSGHRMVVWKKYIILFGGFQTTIRRTIHYNDLYLLSLLTYNWKRVDYLTPLQTAPEPRSGSMFVAAPKQNYVLLYGGFYVEDNGRVVKGKEYNDSWVLDLKPLIDNPNVNPIWTRLKRVGNYPSPRAAFSTVIFKNMAILFGGVLDHDDGGMNISSTFYNDLYSFHFDQMRWYSFKLKDISLVDASPSKHESIEDKHDEDYFPLEQGEEDLQHLYGYHNKNEELTQVFIATPTSDQHKLPIPNTINSLATDQPSSILHPTSNPFDINSSPNSCVNQNSKFSDKPLPRISANLSVRGNTLYLYGGMVEFKKKNIYLNDCWFINLLKRNKWECIQTTDLNLAVYEHEESDSDSSDLPEISDEESLSENEFYGEDSSDNSSDKASCTNEEVDDFCIPEERKFESSNSSQLKPLKEELLYLMEKLHLDDPLITPEKNESLAKFFTRTKTHWISVAQDDYKSSKDKKEISKLAFQKCGDRYFSLIPYRKYLNKS